MQLQIIPIEIATPIDMELKRDVRRTGRLPVLGGERCERLWIQLRCARIRYRFDRNKGFRARLGSRLDVDFEGRIGDGRSRLRGRVAQTRGERSGHRFFDLRATDRAIRLRLHLGLEVVRRVIESRIDT